MDQDAFKKTYREVNERYCVFEKGVLTNQCGCSEVEKLCIAEREAAHCKSDSAQQRCSKYLDILRKHARFALKLTDDGSALPHAKAIKLQIGGLRGLRSALSQSQSPDNSPVEDVSELLLQALEKYQALTQLPFSHIMQQVAAYEGRKRRGNK